MIFYHGTACDSITTEIVAPCVSGIISEAGRKKNIDKVFFTTSHKSAMIYAQRAANSYGGTPRVLTVQPVGSIVCLNNSKGTEVFYSESALVITA